MFQRVIYIFIKSHNINKAVMFTEPLSCLEGLIQNPLKNQCHIFFNLVLFSTRSSNIIQLVCIPSYSDIRFTGEDATFFETADLKHFVSPNRLSEASFRELQRLFLEFYKLNRNYTRHCLSIQLLPHSGIHFFIFRVLRSLNLLRQILPRLSRLCCTKFIDGFGETSFHIICFQIGGSNCNKTKLHLETRKVLPFHRLIYLTVMICIELCTTCTRDLTKKM